jgi:hypothetical protein
MASDDDFLTSLKGVAQNIGGLIAAMGAPGRTMDLLGTSIITSPVGTLFTAIGTSSLALVTFNAGRRAISFHNCDPTNNTTIWVTPLSVATAGQGVCLVPGQNYLIDARQGANCSWAAIAGLGSTNTLLILEFV